MAGYNVEGNGVRVDSHVDVHPMDVRPPRVSHRVHPSRSQGAPMNIQADVREFHMALGIPVETTPALRRAELRASLIEEEAKETVEAIREGDLVGAIDGLCDLLCVVYGAAAEFGVDLGPFWREIHRTNMEKVGGPKREDGKVLKPAGWQPPDIVGILARMM